VDFTAHTSAHVVNTLIKLYGEFFVPNATTLFSSYVGALLPDGLNLLAF
jgi:hypothetical protein